MKMHRNFDALTIIRRGFAGLVAGVALITMGACTAPQTSTTSTTESKPTTSTATDPITVTASVNQWGTLAAEIGGEHVKVASIISSTNVEAHDFEPTTGDIAALHSSQVAVVNGAGYDEWAVKAVTQVKEITEVNAASIVGASASDNPHLWFSKDARKAVAENLAKTYSTLLPPQKDYFAEQLKKWQAAEDSLNQKISQFTAQHKDKAYAATEAVAYYLFSDLGLKDNTPEGYKNASANDAEPSAVDIQQFQGIIEAHQVALVVNNPQESNDETNMIIGTAGRASVPVVDVTEQMPDKYTSLTQWIEALIDSVNQSLA